MAKAKSKAKGIDKKAIEKAVKGQQIATIGGGFDMSKKKRAGIA